MKQHIKWAELKQHLTNNYVWVLTVSLETHTLTYHGIICFRENKKPPEKIHIKVNRKSKSVMYVESENYGRFNSIQEAIDYTRKGRS